ncbi:lysis protein [Pseudomonas aeruginosa]|uniref:Bacteriophage lysis family protein n=1 Tax=Pseudomonas paraeruginosa TaxID=2994495 RepID=A0A2R3IUB6_9PSED|nr:MULTISPECIES: lysis system i-spanin subunit Rz [Pseudomonas aeruginosa group]AVK05509.1 bacteriophage lysis family protein [Pseudomonas paraeruginosa]AWE92398.1 bacteriophage lysis family protein [Pseudomonas paraeruginosa]KSD65739.1 lysis protein [Pseudomonas aeruginosa]MBX6032234.1 lysis protein [Pseudomonas aeruginosa]MCT9630676.1 lysis protein [Pseudomonas aeruginosa]
MSRVLLALVACIVALLIERGCLQRTNDRATRDLLDARREVDGLQQAAQVAGELLAARDALDLKHTQELNNERNANERLRAAVDAGRQRLHVKATCPAPVPTDAGAAGLAAAGAAELDRAARQDYYALRDELRLTRRMVLAWQDYGRSCYRRFSTQPRGSTQ